MAQENQIEKERGQIYASMSVRIYHDLIELSEAVANELVNLSREAIDARGCFTLALAGGNTPRALYEVLARDHRETIEWKRVHLFWSDERYVPPNDPQSNYRLVKESLLNHISIPKENIHPIPTLFQDPKEAAEAYSKDIVRTFGKTAPSFDLVLLGLGPDGHTASLFPGSNFDLEYDGAAIVTQSPVPPRVRISLTMKAINASHNIFSLVSGSEKAGILRAVLQGRDEANPSYPAAWVRPEETLIWFVDKAAASNLQ